MQADGNLGSNDYEQSIVTPQAAELIRAVPWGTPPPYRFS
jgi:hypothetical protein